MSEILEQIFDFLIDSVEECHEYSMALAKEEAVKRCRQECRLLLGKELFCNKTYEHAEIYREIGNIMELFVGIRDSMRADDSFPAYIEEEDFPIYAYVLCNRKTGRLEDGPLCRDRHNSPPYDRRREYTGRIGKRLRKLLKRRKRKIFLTYWKCGKVNIRNANGGLNAEKIDRFLKGFEKGIESGLVSMYDLAEMVNMDEDQLQVNYEALLKKNETSDGLSNG